MPGAIFPLTSGSLRRGPAAFLLGLWALAACSSGDSEPAKEPRPAEARGGGPPPAAPRDIERESHERMLSVLGELARTRDETHPLHNTRNVRILRQRLRELEAAGTATPEERWRLHFDLGKAEVRLGNVRPAIEQFEAAYAVMPEADLAKAGRRRVTDPDSFFRNLLTLTLGVAHLRLGEVENCCARHTPESCIVPIRGGGLHTVEDGARAAIPYFLEVLENRPAEPDFLESVTCEKTAHWLLNIAYMTLGEFPDGVPEEYRVDLDQLYPCEVDDFPRFENVLPELGLDTFNLAGSVVIDDFDGDEYLDVVTCTWDVQGQTRFFRNERDGTFADRTREAGLEGIYGGLNMVQADYDGDGDTDLFVLRGSWLGQAGRHPNSLLSNDGKGRFTDVTFAAGLGEVHYPTKTGAWADYDLDGDLDLYVGNETRQLEAVPGQLFRNEGDGTFVDVAAEAGLDEALFAMGAVWGDYDGDRYPDLYVSAGKSELASAVQVGGANRLYHNEGDGTFREVATELGVERPGPSFPCWFWDYDNDGNLDLYVSCSSGPVAVLVSDLRMELNALYQGDGRGGFTEVSAARQLTFPAEPMGANFGDLNNDGYPDFYLATGKMQFLELRPNVMFLNLGGERFTNVTMPGGFGHLQKGHGVSFADLDNDGDCEVYAQLGGGWLGDEFNDALFENPGFGTHFLTVELEGRRSNRSAIGARLRAVVVERGGENGAERSVYRHVSSGGSFGANPLRQTLGLGSATTVERLEVYWPASDTTQVFEDVAADRFLRIVEGEEDYEVLELERLNLGGS